MHRRARHLNAKSAGAGLVLDARRLTGLNDGDAVSTWSDVSGNGRNATGVGTERPLYKTAIQGGQPVLRFDGSNDNLSLTATSAVTIFKNKSYGIVILVFADSASSSGDSYHQAVYFARGSFSGSRVTISSRSSGVSGLFTGGRRLDSGSFTESLSAGSPSSMCVASGVFNFGANSQSARRNGIAGVNGTFSDGAGSTSNTDSSTALIGATSASASRLNGDIASLILIGQSTSTGLLKRLEHSAAFSFKIQCS